MLQLGHRGRRWRRCDVARVVFECQNTALSSVQIGVKLSTELMRTAASITTKIAVLGLRKNMPRKTHYRPRYPRENASAIAGGDGRPKDEGAFARAMREAIASGAEAPPMLGIDKTPGTRAPMALAHMSSLETANVLADV